MSVITADPKSAVARPARPVSRPSPLTAWAALTGRRLALSAHTPREILAPLVTPILFALVIAPALATMIPTSGPGGVDYRTFVIVGTVGLLIPLTCAFAGIGVIVDRTTGARRELLAAPVRRGLIVAGNLTVAVLTSALQISVLMLAGWARGSAFDVSASGVVWFVVAVFVFTVFMYSVAEILANRMPTQEEYVGLVPVVAILPWFLAGSLFRITALPVGLAGIARVLPTTHVLALLRYGILDRNGDGLHDIWGFTNTTVDATLSMLVLVAWATLLVAGSMRIFHRAAVN
ncbi:MAG TPA: ABC transporter permease [Jatrophihabitantaceae bacterium]|jgi:ABC-2 type transport system permease protein